MTDLPPIVRLSPDGLSRETWTFVIDSIAGPCDIHVKVNTYAMETRTTRRQKFKVARSYSRLGRDSNRYKGLDAVPLPEDVATEIVEAVEERIRVRVVPTREAR